MQKLLLAPCFSLLLGGVALASPATWLAPECEIRLGESVMLPLRLAEPAAETTTGALEMHPPGVVEVLRDPEFLTGQTLGFTRIRTLKSGEVVLKFGDSKLKLTVSRERPVSMVRQMRPRITSPSEGSHAWGPLAIGAEIWVGAPGVDRKKIPQATLHLPDGRKIEPTETFPPVDGPFWRLVFHVDSGSLKAGDCEITVSAKPPIEGAGEKDVLVSEPHVLRILPPPAKDEWIVAGECEDALDTPRTERMGSEPPGVVMVPGASGFRAVALRRSRPTWTIKPNIPEAGRYQLMVRARGTLAGSAYPSLGLVRGEETTEVGAVRLASADWHDVPVGRPIRLEAGPQWLGLGLANDFNYRNQLMRIAEIDSYSLRRVPEGGSGEGGMMMAGGMMMNAEKPEGKSDAPRANRLRAAFSTLAEGDSIRGRTTFSASLHSPSLRNEKDYVAIRSDLWINGRRVASDYGQSPKFTVRPHDFKPGANTLQVHAISPCGNQALSLEQTVMADAPGHPKAKLATTYQTDRHDLQRGAWNGIDRVEIKPEHALVGDQAPSRAHFLKPGRSVRFEISQNTTGPRRIAIHARTLPDAPPGVIAVKLHQPDARSRGQRDIELGRVTTTDNWQWLPLDAVELSGKRKTLTLELVEGGAALGGFSIDTQVFVDAAPPTVEIVYPKAGSEMSADGDALVIRAFDELALSHFELFIDGKKSPLPYPAGDGTGPLVLAVPAAWLSPGARTLEVAAIDESGKSTRSAAVRVKVRKESGPTLTLAYPRAVRLAKNLGLGIDARTLSEILTKGESSWLDAQLATTHPEEPHVDALAAVWFGELSDYGVRGRVATTMLATRHPVRARFAHFAQNHFSTWISKTGATAKWREHQAFRDVGPARFQDLLLTSATSPAMMVYLDQQSSFGRQLNENYARELMELHTVGVHAGYSQDDVTNLARLLSGWGAQREATMDGMTTGYEYRYSPYLAEPGPLEIFGLSVPAAGTPDTADDRVRLAIEMLAARPQTARFIAEKLVAHYHGLPSDEATVAALESEFLRTGGNLRAMLATLATSPGMMAVLRAEKILPPVDFAVAAQRAAASLQPHAVINLADRSGRNLFDRASPDGFPESNDEYADSNYQLQKWRFCKEIEWQLRGGLPGSAFTKDFLADEANRNALIDLAFATRHGASPSSSTRAALHKILAQGIADENQHRNLFTSFLHMTPEFQSR